MRCRAAMLHGALSFVTLVVGPDALRAEVVPAAGSGDRRIRTAPYSPDEVYRIVGGAGYIVSLEFAPDEYFMRLYGGDLDAIRYDAQDNDFAFKPAAALVGTNLVIRTNKRRYYIRYSVDTSAEATHAEPGVYVIRFEYPPEPAIAPDPTVDEKLDATLALLQSTQPSNFEYWYCGSPSLKPIAASDDGIHTRLRFAPRTEVPAMFVLAADGTESLLNFSVLDGEVIIHRVAARLILRRGRATGCVVNRAFSGGTQRPPTMTVSPLIERTVREPR